MLSFTFIIPIIARDIINKAEQFSHIIKYIKINTLPKIKLLTNYCFLLINNPIPANLKKDKHIFLRNPVIKVVLAIIKACKGR